MSTAIKKQYSGLTYRVHQKRLEISLWNRDEVLFTRMLATVLGLVTLAFFMVQLSSDWTNASWKSPQMFSRLGMLLLLMIAWSVFLHHILWSHLGREIIHLGTERITIWRDFRLYRQILVDRPYSFIQVSSVYKVHDNQTFGSLILTFDEDLLKSRVLLEESELVHITDLIRNYLKLQAPGQSPLRMVSRKR